MNIENFIPHLLHLPYWAFWILCLFWGLLQSMAVRFSYHNGTTHKSVILSKRFEFFLDGFVAFTTGVQKALWSILHLIHHKNSDGRFDPHSPHRPVKVNFILFRYTFTGPIVPFIRYFALYKKISYFKKFEKITGENISADIENFLADKSPFFKKYFHKYVLGGLIIFFLTSLVLFGAFGILFFLIQFLWLPVFSGFFVNGLGHGLEERNQKNPKDYSTNITIFRNKILNFIPAMLLSLLTMGESLHGEHHKHQTSLRLSRWWYEIDFGWLIISVLKMFGLVLYTKVYDYKNNKYIEWSKF